MDYLKIFEVFIPAEKDVKVSVEPITDGHINTTLKISVKGNDHFDEYILQKVNRFVFKNPPQLMHSIEVVCDHLRQKQYDKEILEFVPNHDGGFLTRDEEGDYWRVIKFIPNTYTVTKAENKEQVLEAAKTLSGFYAKILDLNPAEITESIEGFVNFQKRLNDFKSALKQASEERKKQAEEEIKFINAHFTFPDQFVVNQNNGNFPLRIIHADPKISNVLFDKTTGKGRCVIDLDTLMPSTILYDFGDMIRSYTNLREEDDPNPENVFSREYYDAVKEGFLSALKNTLTTKEIENLDYAGQVVVYVQAVRFLADYLQDDVYYHVDYPTHNLDRTRNQINLLKELIKLDLR